MNGSVDVPFVLITPARNEGKYLPALIQSVVNQRIRPTEWVVVNDGSTDDTNEVMADACRLHPFIRLVSVASGQRRSFGAKARAFHAGYERLEHRSYAFIGNLDADVTFDSDYYEKILAAMSRNPRLGVASGVCWDKTPDGFKCVTISRNHAVGAVHFFRRGCFEAIGGYRPASVGGMDSLAVLTARMKGWETQAFPDLKVYHHKPVDSANARSPAAIAYRAGLTEYHIGTHPLFAVVKALRRWRARPAVLSAAIRLAGYARLWFGGVRRDAPDELVAYLKKEQMATLRAALRGERSGL